MNQETANYIMQRMSKYLDNSQMIKLKDTFGYVHCFLSFLCRTMIGGKIVSMRSGKR